MTTKTPKETTITPAMTVGEAQVRAIFENPALNNKQVLAVVLVTHPNVETTEKCVAWYRSHARKGTLGKSLMAVVEAFGGGGDNVPSAAGNNGAARPRAAMTPDAMAEALRAAGYSVQAGEPVGQE